MIVLGSHLQHSDHDDLSLRYAMKYIITLDKDKVQFLLDGPDQFGCL